MLPPPSLRNLLASGSSTSLFLNLAVNVVVTMPGVSKSSTTTSKIGNLSRFPSRSVDSSLSEPDTCLI